MNRFAAILVVACSTLFCFASPPDDAAQEESIPHPTDPRKRWVAGPHQPKVGATAFGLDAILQYLDSKIDSIKVNCAAAKVPLDEKKLELLRRTAIDSLKRDIKANPEFIWLLGNLIIDEAGRGAFGVQTRAQFRLSGPVAAGHMAINRRISQAMMDHLRAIGSKEQWAATEYCRNQAAFLLRDDVVAKLRKHFESRRNGEFRPNDVKILHLDMESSADPRDIPLPAMKPYILNYLRERLITHWVRYRLDEKQMTSAEAVIDDCTARAERAFDATEKELRKLWVDVAVGLVEREQAKVPWREAVWKFKQAADRVMLPFADEIDKRLDALVTTEQRAKARKAPPSPEWYVLHDELNKAWAAKAEKRGKSELAATQPSNSH